MFQFTQTQYDELRDWFQDLNQYDEMSWPAKANWKTFTGLPTYELYQKWYQRSYILTIVFEEEVQTPKKIGDRFTVSDYNDQLMF